MNDIRSGGRRRLSKWLEALAPAFVCLDSRLVGAYHVTLAEIAELAAEGWSHPLPVEEDVVVRMVDARPVTGGAVG